VPLHAPLTEILRQPRERDVELQRQPQEQEEDHDHDRPDDEHDEDAEARVQREGGHDVGQVAEPDPDHPEHVEHRDDHRGHETAEPDVEQPPEEPARRSGWRWSGRRSRAARLCGGGVRHSAGGYHARASEQDMPARVTARVSEARLSLPGGPVAHHSGVTAPTGSPPPITGVVASSSRTGASSPSRRSAATSTGIRARAAPSSTLTATAPTPGAAAATTASAPLLTSRPGTPAISRESGESVPPTSIGCARIASATVRSCVPDGAPTSRWYA